MDDLVASVSARAVGLDAWDRFEPLTGGRNDASLAHHGDVARVVKRYRPSDDTRGARERAALHALDGAAGTPALLGEADDPPLVVMSFVEGAGSLADALLGPGREHAEDALLAWGGALGRLHDAGAADVRRSFAQRLEARAPGLDARSLAHDFSAAAEMYARLLDEVGLPEHRQALDDLRALPEALSDPKHEVLSPADTCPDNNVLTPDGACLIDFEHAELRHRAWDVAYLRSPWPSCWCAWLIPSEVADRAVTAYVDAAGRGAAYDGFEEHLRLATIGWQAMTPAWFLDGALAGDDAARASRGPTRRAFVLHRLGAVAAARDLPALADMATHLRGELVRRWGEVDLALAPAFREDRQ
jgi:hypothetical protein